MNTICITDIWLLVSCDNNNLYKKHILSNIDTFFRNQTVFFWQSTTEQ